MTMMMAEVREVSYAELLTIKNEHTELLQQRKALLEEGLASLRTQTTRASVSLAMLGELVDDLIVDFCFEVHRKLKTDHPVCHICRQACEVITNSAELLNGTMSGAHPLGIGVTALPSSDPGAFECDHCHNQRVGASRYAPHLEKCMGRGRTSARNSLRKSQTTSQTVSQASSASDPVEADGATNGGDYDDDEDYVEDGKRKKKPAKGKAKRAKASAADADDVISVSPAPIPSGTGRGSTGTGTAKRGIRTTSTQPVDAEAQMRSYAAALVQRKSQAELRQQFEQFCGVLSSSTGKSCNKSIRCSIHSEDQRALVRRLVLQADFHNPSAQAANVPEAADPVNDQHGDYDPAYHSGGDYAASEAASTSPRLADVTEYIDIEGLEAMK